MNSDSDSDDMYGRPDVHQQFYQKQQENNQKLVQLNDQRITQMKSTKSIFNKEMQEYLGSDTVYKTNFDKSFESK